MDIPRRTWPICLTEPPQVAQIACSIHGSERLERYRLPDFWCLHLYRYHARVQLGEWNFPIHPGCVSIVPADMPIVYRYRGHSAHLYVHFRPDPSARGGKTVPIPAMLDFGDDFGLLYIQLEQVIHAGPDRAQARLWDVLWQLAERSIPETLAGACSHPAVGRAVQAIERRLAEPLRVAALAEEAGVSDSYLARLFQEALGCSVVGYIRQRRVQRAAHLLRHSTLPVKAIAALVGLPDLHQFNKTLHHCTGQSPRALRQAASCVEDSNVI